MSPSSTIRLSKSTIAFRLLIAVMVAFTAFVLPAQPAQAAINTTVTALQMAQAMAVDTSIVTNASFVTRAGADGANSSVAVADTTLTSFPLAGSTYAVMSTGRAGPITTGSPDPTYDLGGVNVRGDTDFDVTILKVDLNVPSGYSCLSFNFRFLSSEWPEFVGTDYNDAFLVELDNSNWSTNGSTISAPNNFVKDSNGNPITINSTGALVMTSANAAGTVFGDTFGGNPYSPYGATPVLQASTPITSGAHSLYFSIFDQADNAKDSAAFIDELYLTATEAGDCTPGVGAPPDPVLTKSFSPASIQAGQTSQLTFTLANGYGNPARTSLKFTDTLPTGAVFTGTPSTTCAAGAGSIGGGGQTFTFTGGALNATDASCTVTVTVQGNTAGIYPNTAASISKVGKVNPSRVDSTLTVTAVTAKATLTKSFIRATIGTSGTATLRFTIANSTGNPATNGLSFTDTLPANLTVSGTPATPQCGGAISSTSGSVTLTGGSLAAGVASCAINVTVTSTVLGTYVNNSSNFSNVSSNLDVSGANATLRVVSNAALTKAFSPTSINIGQTSTLTFTITNGAGDPARTDMDFTDTMPAGLTVSGTPTTPQCGGAVSGTGNLINVTNAAMAAGIHTCTITVTVTSSTTGVYNNASANISNLSGALLAGSVNATLTVNGPAFTSVPPSTQTVTVGGLAFRSVFTTIAVTNTGNAGTTLNVTQVSLSNPIFTVTGLPLSVAQGAAAQNITVRCTPLPGAAQTGTLVVQTDEAGDPQYTFNLSCKALPQNPGVFRPSSRNFHLRNSNSSGVADFSLLLGVANDLPVVGDWNNDGIETVGVYRPSTGQFFLKNVNSTGAPVVYAFAFGAPGDLPVAGDWNDDAFDSVGIYRPSTGRFLLRNTLNTGFADYNMPFGTATDTPVMGDWDGNGVDTPAYYRASTQRWYFTNQMCNCTPTQAGVIWYGLPGDLPVVGDWDADGVTGIGVWRTASQIYYIKNNPMVGSFSNKNFRYGLPNDLPLAGIWSTQASLAPQFEANGANNAEGPAQAPVFNPGNSNK